MPEKEYIEREKEYIEVSKLPNIEVTLSNNGKYLLLPFEHLSDIPRANVAEVVRCKDCKHWETDKDYSQKPWCSHWTLDSTLLYTKSTDFCSYGERKIDD